MLNTSLRPKAGDIINRQWNRNIGINISADSTEATDI